MSINRKVIYTCLTGAYDELLQPLSIDDSFDYICFSNDIKDDRIGVWQIRPIPFYCKDNARLSRYVKILPYKVLEEYDWSLWIDANIQISDKKIYEILKERIMEEMIVCQVNHIAPPCDCTYEEIKYAFALGRSGFIKSLNQYYHLKKEHFPTHWGLFENNIILRKHNDGLVKKISVEWWNEFMIYTKRDQFSLMYIYWKNSFKPAILFLPNQNSRNVDFLVWHYHPKDTKFNLVKSVRLRLHYLLRYSFSIIDLIF